MSHMLPHDRHSVLYVIRKRAAAMRRRAAIAATTCFRFGSESERMLYSGRYNKDLGKLARSHFQQLSDSFF